MWVVLLIQHAILCAVLAALYLLFAGEVSVSEIEAGLPVVVATALLIAAERRTAKRRWSHHVAARAIYRPVLSLLPDAFKVGRVLFESILHRPAGRRGFILHQPFHAGGAHAAGAATRRGVTELGISLAPNAFAVCLSAEALDLHCLASRQPDPDAEWPA